MSKRSKRRRDPETAGGPDAGRSRAAEPGRPASSGRPGEARQAGRRGAGGRLGETRQPGRGGAGRAGAAPRRPGRSAGQPAASTWGLGVQLGFLAAVFAVVVLIAELAGAANLGVALGIGQIAFAIAVVYLLVWR